MGWNSLVADLSWSWLLRLTRVTLPPWVMLVTRRAPAAPGLRWLLLRLTGLVSLCVLSGLAAPALLTDLVTPGPILTTLTLASEDSLVSSVLSARVW